MFDGLRAQTLLKQYNNNHYSDNTRQKFVNLIYENKLNIKNKKVLNAYIELLSNGIHYSGELGVLVDHDIPMEILYSNESFRKSVKEYYDEIFKFNNLHELKFLTKDKFFEKMLLNADFKNFINIDSLKKNIDLKIVNGLTSGLIVLDEDIKNMLLISEKIGHKVFSIHHFLSDDIEIARYDYLIYKLINLNLLSNDILDDFYYKIYNSTLSDGYNLAYCLTERIENNKFSNMVNILKNGYIFDNAFFSMNKNGENLHINDIFDENGEPKNILFTKNFFGSKWQSPLGIIKNVEVYPDTYNFKLKYKDSFIDEKRLTECLMFLSMYSDKIPNVDDKKFIEFLKDILDFENFGIFDITEIFGCIKLNMDSDIFKINELIDENGYTDKMYELILSNFVLAKKLIDTNNKNLRSFSSSEISYLKNIIIDRNFFEYMHKFCNNKRDVSKYFNGYGFSELLYDKALFDKILFKELFNRDEFSQYYHTSEEIVQYIQFTKVNGFILTSIIQQKEDIVKYFDSTGPKIELYDKALFNRNLFYDLFKVETWKNYYNLPTEIEQYIEFIKTNGFILVSIVHQKEDIVKYFDETGPKTKKIFIDLLKNDVNNELLNNSSYDKYYEELCCSYINNIEPNLLKKMNIFLNNDFIHGNHTVLLKLMIKMDYQPKDISVNKALSNTTIFFNYFDNEQLNDIFKYCLLYDDNSMEQLSNIINCNNLDKFWKIYNFLFNEWNIDDFKSLITNYMDNQLLCESIVEYIDSASAFIESSPHLFDNKKVRIKKILVSGDKNVIGKILTVNDLNNYEQIIYNQNINLIHDSDDIFEIKENIYKLLFNIDADIVLHILQCYNYNDSKLDSIIDTLGNNDLKEKVLNIASVLEFINSLDEETDIYKLKEYLKIINEKYLNDSEDIELLWSNFDNVGRVINAILGMEINEKITDFNELIDMAYNNDIPLDKNENALFKVDKKILSSDFDYDGNTFKEGTEIPYIELTGLPFVTFGHVLNAYGSGGKVSDFNNPRLIGRTHLCLSAIDDNYYDLVGRTVFDINHVQLLFSSLPANQLVIASEHDVASGSENNSRTITSRSTGNYNSVRENISNTYHGYGGYNEYVYYRDDIRPSAVLIKGDEPNEAELQAAAYLQVSLVKINKQYYPERTRAEMKQRDQELKEFYKEMYKRRKKKQSDVNEQNDEISIKFLLIREQLGQLKSYYDDMAIKESAKTR